MSSAEITNLDALRDTLADLAQWSSWTGLATTAERLDRIACPELDDAAALPAISVDFGAGRRVNSSGSDPESNFRPFGRMVVSVYDLDDESDGTLTERYRAFADKFFELMDQLAAAQGPVIVNNLAYPEPPIVRTPVNIFGAQDANADGIDDATEVLIWVGVFSFDWGGPPES